MRHRVTAVALGALLLTQGCGGEDDVQRDIEQVAAEARGFIDQLAADVGTDPEVRQDVITDCTPGDRDSGKDLIYNVRVSVGPDALDRLRDDIVPRYEDDGWTAKFRGDDNVQLRRDNVTMGVTVFSTYGQAAVSGTGGCVR